MQLYNTLTRQKEEFVPLNGKLVKMYVCGPTVYDKGHLGHGRSMIAFDFVRRYLMYKGYEVEFVSNYTDIDDKMINRAAEENTTVPELAARIIATYEEDFAKLNIMPPTIRPLATNFIPEMIVMVKKLLADDYAYQLEDGVYFDVTKFDEYGQLSKQILDELQAGARVDVVVDKRNPQDFVMWKQKKEGEPSWIDPEGVLAEGRPGWHIECSAMIWKLLGETLDIHGGGADLVFPHHECEIAQSEACFHKQYVKYWLHNGYVQIDGEKMSKSLNNFFTLDDIFKEHNPLVVRYALMSVHYRGPIDFNADVLHQAAQSLQRIRDFVARLEGVTVTKGDLCDVVLKDLKLKFEAALDDDLEVSRALAALFDLIKEVNVLMDANELSEAGAKAVVAAIREVDQIFGCIFMEAEQIPVKVTELVTEREKARAEKDFARSDELRDELLELGFIVEDGPAGPVIKKKLH